MTVRILIVKLSSLGDVVHTLPSALALRRALPEATIGWAVERAHAGVLAGQAAVDELLIWERTGIRSFVEFAGRLRAGRWDVAIDYQGLLRSGLLCGLSGARLRIGYTPTRERAHWFYNRRIPLATLDRHAVERSLDLTVAALEALGLSNVNLESLLPGLAAARPGDSNRIASADRATTTDARSEPLFPLYPTAEDRAAVDEFLAIHRVRPQLERLVVLNPHCRKAANRWPADRFRALTGRLLARPGTRVALIGGQVARELCDSIAGPWHGRVLRADGQFSLLGTAELLGRADLLVTGDTGPMHLAAAMDTPIVALFGPANPVRTGPFAPNAIVLNKQLSCAPCFAREACPLGHVVPACLDEISIHDVLAAIDQQLRMPHNASSPVDSRWRASA